MKVIRLYWYRHRQGSGNFGDELNPYIIEKLSGKKARFTDVYFYGLTPYIFLIAVTYHYYKRRISLKEYMRYIYGYFVTRPKILVAIGSVLQIVKCKNAIIWGAGIISSNVSRLVNVEFLAVRGERTKQKIVELGYVAPSVVGDPALLLPLLYSPITHKKYKVGIIPHFIHYADIAEKIKGDDVLIISLTDPIEKIINEINSCELTFSTSLHGIIVSHAYQVPSVWVTDPNKKLDGDDVKFDDYFSSVDVNIYEPIKIEQLLETNIGDFYALIEHLSPKDILPTFDKIMSVQKNLLKSFPYEMKDKYADIIKDKS